MPRNRSEKPPYECSDVEPDFYKLLRLYARDLVKAATPSTDVREGQYWGHSKGADELFSDFPQPKRERWWDWSGVTKRDYLADYVDYLYATQSK